MRRFVSVVVVLGSLAACAYDPGPVRPGATAATGVSAPAPGAPTGPTGTTPTFTTEGCPVDDPAFCEQATFLANALVVGDADAVFALARAGRFDCSDLDAASFSQCEHARTLEGYLVSGYQDQFFVDPPKRFRNLLGFLVEAVDPAYEDELGGSAMQVLGVSTCGRGQDVTHHLVYTVGLNDPQSTLPGDRFLGTYGFQQQGGEWAIGISYVGLYTDWQLALDDPLTEIACGHVRPWAS